MPSPLRAPGALAEFLAYPAFLRLWGARVLGGVANQMLMMGAAWQMYELTGSAWDLGLVGLYQFAPVLVFTLVAGHAADRFHRGRIIAAALAVQFVAGGCLLAATYGNALSRELLFGVSVLLGIARTFQMPAQQSLVASLIPVGMLARATALSSAGNQVAVIGGPALAGLLFALGGSVVYGVSIALLAAGFALIVGVHYDRSGQLKIPTDAAALLAGVRFVFGRPVLLGAISLDLMAVLFGGATALLPIFARDVLHVGAVGLGVLRSAPAVGALLMSVVLAHQSIGGSVGRKMFGAVAVYGVAMLVFGLSESFVLSLLALAVSGAADMVSVVVRQTLVQLETPDHLRGRVGAVNSIFIGASNQLGEFESGATAALLGPVGSVVLGSFGTLAVVGLWWRWFPGLARWDRFDGH